MTLPAPELGTPRTLDAREHPCRCVRSHRPAVSRTHRHHVVPLAWGGADAPENVVPLCPSGHDLIHLWLQAWARAGEPFSIGPRNDYLYALARRGWEGRPS